MIDNAYHINFPVSDLKKAITFYENVLGHKKTGEWANCATFDVGGVQFGLQPRGKRKIFLTCDNIDKAYKELREKGVRFLSEPKDKHWGTRAATFIDPDGNKFTIATFKK